MENTSCIQTLLGPVRPVRPTGQTGRSCQTGYRRFDRSNRLSTPVRPVSANFGYQQEDVYAYSGLIVGLGTQKT